MVEPQYEYLVQQAAEDFGEEAAAIARNTLDQLLISPEKANELLKSSDWGYIDQLTELMQQFLEQQGVVRGRSPIEDEIVYALFEAGLKTDECLYIGGDDVRVNEAVKIELSTHNYGGGFGGGGIGPGRIFKLKDAKWEMVAGCITLYCAIYQAAQDGNLSPQGLLLAGLPPLAGILAIAANHYKKVQTLQQFKVFEAIHQAKKGFLLKPLWPTLDQLQLYIPSMSREEIEKTLDELIALGMVEKDGQQYKIAF